MGIEAKAVNGMRVQDYDSRGWNIDPAEREREGRASYDYDFYGTKSQTDIPVLITLIVIES